MGSYAEGYASPGIVGRSAPMVKLARLIARVAASHANVLIEGESGTGKELVARAIHRGSPRDGSAFIGENCAALSESLIESELFGHVRGAFTGAERDRRGLFALADGGTLFLDEVGDMSARIQAKLLRVLQEGEFRPLGGCHRTLKCGHRGTLHNRPLEVAGRQYYSVTCIPSSLI